jgi:hypothetical protein
MSDTIIITDPTIVSSAIPVPQVLQEQTTEVAIQSQVLPGPPGPAGPQYTHYQNVPNTTWTVNHNLGYKPHITVLGPGGTTLICDIVHTNVNQAVLLFRLPTSGTAYCS